MDGSARTAVELELVVLSVILPKSDIFIRMDLCNTRAEAHLLARELSRFLAIKAHDRDLNY